MNVTLPQAFFCLVSLQSKSVFFVFSHQIVCVKDQFEKIHFFFLKFWTLLFKIAIYRQTEAGACLL